MKTGGIPVKLQRGVSDMKVSIDGLRSNATADVNKLCESIKDLIKDIPDYIDFDEVVEKFNQVANNVGIFNCVFSDDMEDFNDMSEKLKVNEIEDDFIDSLTIGRQ